jgi:predicted heme/steroid binding protein
MIYKYIIKIDRVAAWVLLFVVLAYGITGYGMTKGIIDPQISRLLHLNWLGAIGLVVFIIHTSWSVCTALKRWGVWNILTKSLLSIFYIALISFFIYVQFFYHSAGVLDKNLDNQPTSTMAEAGTTIFTAETLAKYNGLNGQPAYVAVDGVVYDVSDIFRNGKHEGCLAGQDLTSKFYQDHSSNMLNGYAIVGTFETE